MHAQHPRNLQQRPPIKIIGRQATIAPPPRSSSRLLQSPSPAPSFQPQISQPLPPPPERQTPPAAAPVAAPMMIHMPLRQRSPQPANQRSSAPVRLQRAPPFSIPRRQPIKLRIKLIGQLAAQRLAAGNRNRRPHQRLPVNRNKPLPCALVPGRAGPRQHQIAQPQPAKILRLLQPRSNLPRMPAQSSAPSQSHQNLAELACSSPQPAASHSCQSSSSSAPSIAPGRPELPRPAVPSTDWVGVIPTPSKYAKTLCKNHPQKFPARTPRPPFFSQRPANSDCRRRRTMKNLSGSGWRQHPARICGI